MQRIFQQSYFLGPALAANHTINFKMPCDAQLVHVSMSNSTANQGTLKIGTSTDDDGYCTAKNIGLSSAVTEVSSLAGFDGVLAGGQYPHISKGTQVLLTITDHASHIANVAIVLTFTEG